MKYLLSLLMVVVLSSITYAQHTIYRENGSTACFIIVPVTEKVTTYNQYGQVIQTRYDTRNEKRYVACPAPQYYGANSNVYYRNDNFQRSTNVNLVITPGSHFLPLNIGLNNGVPWNTYYRPFFRQRVPRINYVNFGNPANAYMGLGGQFGQYLFSP